MTKEQIYGLVRAINAGYGEITPDYEDAKAFVDFVLENKELLDDKFYGSLSDAFFNAVHAANLTETDEDFNKCRNLLNGIKGLLDPVVTEVANRMLPALKL